MYLKRGVIQIFFRLVEPLFSKYSCRCEIKHVNYGSLRQAHTCKVLHAPMKNVRNAKCVTHCAVNHVAFLSMWLVKIALTRDLKLFRINKSHFPFMEGGDFQVRTSSTDEAASDEEGLRIIDRMKRASWTTTAVDLWARLFVVLMKESCVRDCRNFFFMWLKFTPDSTMHGNIWIGY